MMFFNVISIAKWVLVIIVGAVWMGVAAADEPQPDLSTVLCGCATGVPGSEKICSAPFAICSNVIGDCTNGVGKACDEACAGIGSYSCDARCIVGQVHSITCQRLWP